MSPPLFQPHQKQQIYKYKPYSVYCASIMVTYAHAQKTSRDNTSEKWKVDPSKHTYKLSILTAEKTLHYLKSIYYRPSKWKELDMKCCMHIALDRTNTIWQKHFNDAKKYMITLSFFKMLVFHSIFPHLFKDKKWKLKRKYRNHTIYIKTCHWTN